MANVSHRFAIFTTEYRLLDHAFKNWLLKATPQARPDVPYAKPPVPRMSALAYS